MKKIICLVLSLLICLPVVTPTANAESFFDLSEYGNEMSLLVDFGIIKGEEAVDMQISRAEFATIVVRLLGIDRTFTAMPASTFSDVPRDHWAAANIAFAVDAGYFSGYGDGSFGPDDGITLAQASKVLVKLLGYEAYASAKGGYPQGYISQAESLGLFEGIKTVREREATRGMIYLMVYNALETDIAIATSFGEDIGYTTYDGRNILTEYLKIYKEEAVITATTDAAMDDGDLCDSGEIRLDEVSYTYAKSAGDVLGIAVDAYYREKGSKRELITYTANSDNSVVELTSDNIKSFDTSSLCYTYSRTDKDVRYRISDERTRIVYNGRRLNQNVHQYLIPEMGNVRLVDNNADSIYELVQINEYYNLVVDRYSENYNKIYDRTDIYASDASRDVALDDFEAVLISNAEGKSMQPSSIAADSIITVMKSADGNTVRLLLSSRTVTGKLSELSLSEGIAVIAGKSYTLSDDIRADMQNISIGNIYIAYINSFGDIAFLKQELSDGNVGYLYGVRKSNGLDSDVYIRIFDATGEALVFKSPDKLQVESCSGIQINSDRMEKEEIYNFLLNQRTPVIFEAEMTVDNAQYDGILKKLIMPGVVSDEAQLDFVSQYPLLKLEFLTSKWPGLEGFGEKSITFQREYYGFDNWTVFNKEGTAFNVPPLSQPTISDDELSVQGIWSIEDDRSFKIFESGNGEYNSIDVYANGGFSVRSNLLVIYSSGSGATVSEEGYASIVTRIGYGVNPVTEEEQIKLSLIGSDGTLKDYYLSDDSMLEAAYLKNQIYSGIEADLSPDKKSISRGDAIKFTANSVTGEISDIVLLYDCENNKLTYEKITSKNILSRAALAKVNKIDADCIEYELPGGGIERTQIRSAVIVYDCDTDTAVSGGLNDIEPDDIVFINSRWAYIGFVVVYKK